MALTVCPECNKQVSDKADACPECGYSFKTVREQKAQKQEEESTNMALWLGCGIPIAVGLFFVLFVFASIGPCTAPSSSEKTNPNHNTSPDAPYYEADFNSMTPEQRKEWIRRNPNQAKYIIDQLEKEKALRDL